MKYAYFPGCSLHSTAKEYDLSTKEVARAAGIELVEIPDWICCGATPAHITMHLLSLALPVKNLIQAKKMGSTEVATCCSACFNRLKVANKFMENDNQKSPSESVIQVIFHRKNPVRPSSPLRHKVLRVCREIVIWAFWLLVAYIFFLALAACGRMGAFACM